MFVKFTGSFSLFACQAILRWLSLVAATIVLPVAGNASATEIPAPQNRSAYLQDGQGMILRSATGLCWRNGFWMPSDAVAGCDGSLAPPISPLIAPDLPREMPAPTQTSSTPAAAIPTRPAVQNCIFELALEGDDAFAFGSAALSFKGRQRLEQELLPKLKDCPAPPDIKVTGHTDSLGSAAYNLRLSRERAQAVAEYLAKSGNADSMDKLEIIGAGASQARQQCASTLKRAELIACFAPDRRVLIEVHGTQM